MQMFYLKQNQHIHIQTKNTVIDEVKYRNINSTNLMTNSMQLLKV